MKTSLLLTLLSCLLIPVVAFGHGGIYTGPGGVGTGPGFTPAGTGTPGSTGGPGGTGGSTGGGVGIAGGTSGGTGPSFGGSPGGPGAGPSAGGGSTGPRGATSSGGRKKASNAYLNWELWWELNDDRFLLLKKKLRQIDDLTTNQDIFMGDSSVNTNISEVNRKSVRQQIIPALWFALSDPYYDARAGAVIALAKVAHPTDEDSFMRIKVLLKDPHMQVRESACIALGLLGNKEGIPLLKDIISNNSRGKDLVGRQNDVLNRTRSFAAMALGFIGLRVSGTDITEFLVNVIKSKNMVDLKVAAAQGLYLVDERRGVPDLIDLYNDRELSPHVRAHVGIALGKLKARSSAQTLLKGISNKNDHIARSSAIALGLVANPEDKQAVKMLRKRATAGGSRATRNFSMISLGELGSDLGLKTLLERLRRGQPMDKAYAALALGTQGFNGNLKEKAEVTKLVYGEYKNTKAPSLKGALAISIGLLDGKQYAEDIRKDIDNISTQRTQGHLAIALALLNDQNSIPTIRELVRKRGDIGRRTTAAIALGMLRDREAISLLEDVMDKSSNSKAILGSATVAMGHIGDRSAVPILSKILKNRKDHQDMTRAFATVALGYLGDKDDIPLLSKIHEHCNYMAPTESLSEILTIL